MPLREDAFLERPFQGLLFRPEPFDGESLCSWLFRLARANGHLSIGPLVKSARLDRPIPPVPTVLSPELLSWLCAASGYDQAVIESRVFDGTAHALAAAPIRSSRRWFLRRTSTGKGQAYSVCQHCLAEGEPFWRSRWQFAVTTHCDQHACLLLGSCSMCGATPELSTHRAEPLHVCHQCRTPLTAVRVSGDESDDETKVTRPVNKRWPHPGTIVVAELPEPVAIEALFWDGIWVLVSGFARRGVAARLCLLTEIEPKASKLLAQLAGLPRTAVLEELNAADRDVLLELSRWLCHDWPNRFVAVMIGAKIHSHLLLTRDVDVPYWIWQVVRQYLIRSLYRPSKTEVEAAARWLQRGTDAPISKNKLKQTIGVSESRQINIVVRGRTSEFTWDHVAKLISALDQRLSTCDRARSKRDALLRDAVLIVTCVLVGKTFQVVSRMSVEQVEIVWRTSRVRMSKLPSIATAARWKEEHDRKSRLTSPSSAPIELTTYFSTRFGLPYAGNGAVMVFAGLLKEIRFQDKWRGIGVVSDLN